MQGEAELRSPASPYQKRELVYDTIDHYLARFPKKPRDPGNDLYTHAMDRQPFVVIYDFDNTALRVFFIVHGQQTAPSVDPPALRRYIGGKQFARPLSAGNLTLLPSVTRWIGPLSEFERGSPRCLSNLQNPD